jgi:cysteine desulfurase
MGKAAELTLAALPNRMVHCRRLESMLREAIARRIGEIRFNGHPDLHVPGLVNVSLRYVEGEALLLHMDLRGVSVAGASACMSITAKASHVLEAMGALQDGAVGTLLFTLGDANTEGDVNRAVDTLEQVASMLRAMSPLYERR